MSDNQTHLILALPLDADYTGILAELHYWYTHGTDAQCEHLTTALRIVTDRIHAAMPATIGPDTIDPDPIE